MPAYANLFDAVTEYIGTTSPSAVSEALGTIGKWGATEADYITFLQNAGYTVLEGSNGRYMVYKVGEFFGGNGAGTELSTVFETTAVETTIEGAQVTEMGATGTGTGLLGMEVGAAGYAIAPALGILAGVGLYNLAPEFWTDVSERLQNAGKLEGGKVQALFDSNGKTSFDEDVIEIFKNAFLDAGLFESGTEYPDPIVSPDEATTVTINSTGMDPVSLLDTGISKYTQSSKSWASESVKTQALNELTSWAQNRQGHAFAIYCPYAIYGGSGFSARAGITISDLGGVGSTFQINANNFPIGSTEPSFHISIRGDQISVQFFSYYTGTTGSTGFLGEGYQSDGRDSAYFNSQANVTIVVNPNIQPDATLPDANPFPSKYPNWQPSHTINNNNYYPVSIPTDDITQDPSQTGDNDTDEQEKTIIDSLFDLNPDPDPSPDPEPDPDPQPEPEPEPDPSGDPSQDPINPNPDPIPSGVTPVIPPISGVSATRMFTVYNPTDAEINSLGAFLWTSNIIEQIKKMWEDPMGAIISLHKIYAAPVTGSMKNIVLGYIDSGVDALQVTDQFTTVDCGSVTISETKRNATDYTPFTTAQIYLPFVGIVEIDLNEIMNGTVHVVYKVDAYTGTCLALVYVQRSIDMPNEQLLYTFSGNASQTLPLTSADFSGAVGALLGLAGAGISVASGGALGVAAGAVTAAHSLTHEMVHVQHSGGLSANSGIMGPRTPYIILSRQHGYDANGYSEMYGYPANKTVYIGNTSGFNRAKSVHYYGNGTEEEKAEIESILKEGFIV